MTRPRSILPGDTDSTGVPLGDILDHLRAWSDVLTEESMYLGNVRRRLALLGESASVRDGLEFPDYGGDLFERYSGDVDRLRAELTTLVVPRHIGDRAADLP